jgi:ABC-type transport system involved in multi-copper enzyme maturation permease subunit
MSTSGARIGAVIRKELTEFRRNRFIVLTAAIFPLIFLIEPTVELLDIKATVSSTALDNHVDLSLFLPLIVPVLVPAVLSAASVVGERAQGTLEPALTTPVSRVELLAGKALAIFVPALAISYLIFGVFVTIVAFAARQAVATALLHAPQLPAELVFIPLLAGWSIWVGLAVSTTASEVRVAQQLSMLPSLPVLAVAALMSFQIITPSFELAAALAGGLLVVDGAACFLVARLFDRERLITGSKSTTGIIEGTS